MTDYQKGKLEAFKEVQQAGVEDRFLTGIPIIILTQAWLELKIKECDS